MTTATPRVPPSKATAINGSIRLATARGKTSHTKPPSKATNTKPKPGANKSPERLARMSRARRRSCLVVADYIEHVLKVTGWSQAKLARQLEVPVSRINFFRHPKPRMGRYGDDYQTVAVPFLYEIEEVSNVHLLLIAKPDKTTQVNKLKIIDR